jgi:probable addiction module antidote protein
MEGNRPKEGIMTRTKKYKDHLNEALKDPEEAAAYINAAAEEGDFKYFLVAVRNVADAQGGLGWLSKATGLNRETLYTTLSEKGNPRLDGLYKILKALGVSLKVVPVSPVPSIPPQASISPGKGRKRASF